MTNHSLRKLNSATAHHKKTPFTPLLRRSVISGSVCVHSSPSRLPARSRRGRTIWCWWHPARIMGFAGPCRICVGYRWAMRWWCSWLVSCCCRCSTATRCWTLRLRFWAELTCCG